MSRGTRDPPSSHSDLAASAAGSTRVAPQTITNATASTTALDAPLFAVDETEFTFRDRRIDVSAVNAESLVEELATQSSPGRGVVLVRASRAAQVRWVGVLVRALGRTGVKEIDVVTPTLQGDAHVALKLSPLGQVPMHEDRCGIRIAIRSDGMGELQYVEKRKKLPQGPEGLNVSLALGEMRARTKGCKSTLWMLAAEKDAKWGAAFDVGTAVSASELAEGTSRYIMLL